MDTFVPKYRQPFTLEMAIELDGQTLIMELARLEDSVQRLTDTQTALKEALDEDSVAGRARDRDLLQAYEENVEVIGSQKERIEMIELALQARGVPRQSRNHYVNSGTRPSEASVSGNDSNRTGNGPDHTNIGLPIDDGGIDL